MRQARYTSEVHGPGAGEVQARYTGEVHGPGAGQVQARCRSETVEPEWAGGSWAGSWGCGGRGDAEGVA